MTPPTPSPTPTSSAALIPPPAPAGFVGDTPLRVHGHVYRWDRAGHRLEHRDEIRGGWHTSPFTGAVRAILFEGEPLASFSRFPAEQLRISALVDALLGRAPGQPTPCHPFPLVP